MALNDDHTVNYDWNIILNNADPNHDWKNCSNLERVSGVCSGVMINRVMAAWLAGRNKGLSITEDPTLRQQTEFGQNER